MSQVKIGKWMYKQIQINGERVTTNESFKYCLLSNPNRMEIFIRQIPFTMYEDNLIPLFETIGVVIQFRLMMCHSGRNRGFGYVIYLNRDDGYRAITFLNNILVSSWCRLQLSVSMNSRQLWLGNISWEMDADYIVDLIQEKVEPTEIWICQDSGRQYFILKFATHREAALSRKVLLREILDFGSTARVNWDLREHERYQS